MDLDRDRHEMRPDKLQELARIVRRVRHAEQQAQLHYKEMQRLRLGCKLLTRLSWTMCGAYAELLELTKTEGSVSRRDFADIYGQSMSLADTIIEQVDNIEKTPHTGFRDAVSRRTMNSILRFLHKIRTNHQWVANSLSNLSASEIESCLPAFEIGMRQATSLRETSRKSETISDLQRSDLMFSLVFGLFASPGLSHAEDNLRLELSATIMYQMIQDNKTSSKADKLCLCLFDAWSSMYGWSATKHFETLLLDILHDGVRILDRADSRQLNTKFHAKGYYFNTQRRDEVEEEFYADSVRKIFKLLDNSELGGIPHGALLLSRAILVQVCESDRRHYEAFIIIAWFFNRFLARSIINPEHHGILVDIHISDIKRKRILSTLQERAYSFCLQSQRISSTASYRSTIEEEIDSHVASIFGKFRGQGNSISLQSHKPLSVDNYLTRHLSSIDAEALLLAFHVSPQQIVVLHDFLSRAQRCASPELRTSQLNRQPSSSSTMSSRSLNRTVRSSRIIFDVGLPAHETEEDPADSTASSTDCDASIAGNEDADEAAELRSAMNELQERTSLHHQDLWENVLVTLDSLTMTPDCRDMPTSPGDDQTEIVRKAVYHMLDHFDIVTMAEPRTKISSYFSKLNLNGEACVKQTGPLQNRSKAGLLHQMLSAGQACFYRREYSVADLYYSAHAILQKKSHTAEAIDNFAPVIHGYCIEQMTLLQEIDVILEQDVISRSHLLDLKAKLAQKIDEQISIFAKLRLRMWYQNDVVRSKCWNQSWEVVKCLHKMRSSEDGVKDILPSLSPEQAPYHMNLTRSSSKDRRFSRFSRDHRPSTPTYGPSQLSLHAVDQTLFEAIVGMEPAIPNKLGTEQSRHTEAWMRGSQIHNFCAGEERIQRLCCEVDDLLQRLIGMNTHPLDEIDMEDATTSTIWRSDFFQYENKVFNISKRAQNYRSLDHLAHSPEDSGFGGLLRRGSAGDLLNLNRTVKRSRGNSLGSLDTPQCRRQLIRVSSGTTLFDLDVHKVMPSPVRSTDSSRPSTTRPSSMASENTVKLSPQDEQAIKDFLLQTQLGLTALLLSDFAEMLYWHGSETDEWFGDETTEAIMARRSSLAPSTDEASATIAISRSIAGLTSSDKVVPQTIPTRPKHLRKKSLSISHLFNGSNTYENLKSSLAPPSIDIHMARSNSGAEMERITSSSSNYFDLNSGSDFSITPSTPMRPFHDPYSLPQSFPINKAYKDIMHRFSNTPSPYEKLRALYELELLIVSSLTTTEEIPVVELPKLAPAMPSTPLVTTIKGHGAVSSTVSKTRARKDSVDISKARVEELSIPPVPTTPLQDPQSEVVRGKLETPGTDAIVEEIQKVLRLPDVRPRTLYRDLQFIAAFIPAHILNMTDEGKVFWDFSLAALAIKRDTLDMLVDNAASILEASQDQSTDNKINVVDGPSISEAIKILTNAAKERHCKAMRVFGIFMLQNPHLCPIVLPPFADPAILVKDARIQDDHGNMDNPAVKSQAALVWLQRAARDGDVIARGFLGTNLII